MVEEVEVVVLMMMQVEVEVEEMEESMVEEVEEEVKYIAEVSIGLLAIHILQVQEEIMVVMAEAR